MQKLKVAVIGAGVGGIAAAIRLAVMGHKIEVFEQNAYAGGKLSEISLGPYRFDAGPSLFTYPKLVEELFELAGETASDHFQYIRLEELARYFYEDGTQLSTYASSEKTIQTLAGVFNVPEHSIRSAFIKSKTLFDYLGEMFMFRSLHDWRTYCSRAAIRCYGNLHKMDFLRSMHQANRSYFADPRLIQFFDRYATYNGSNPYETPATMNIIPHLEYGIGAFFPISGMHAITKSLVSLASRLGVTFHYNSPTERILVKNGQVKGLQVDGENLTFDRVICNMDVGSAYRKLLPEVSPPKRTLNQPKSSSALIFYWGIKKEFSSLGLHNIFFSQDYKREFDEIFKRKVISKDPTIYLNISAKHSQNDAPAGCENWFVMINTPHNAGQNWEELIEDARKNILEKLQRQLHVDVASLIDQESYLDPRLIEARTSSSQGALYGNSSNNRLAAFLRHPNFTKRVRGLYFCGGSVHPGGGIPMALSSAKIVGQYFR